MNETLEAIREEWRNGGLESCLAGEDVFLPSAIPIRRIRTWTYLGEPDLATTTVDQVDWAVSKTMEISIQRLHSICRNKDVVIPRFLAMCLINEFCPKRTMKEIGRHFCLDHTTVMHGIRRATVLLAEDQDFRAAHCRARQILMGMQA